MLSQYEIRRTSKAVCSNSKNIAEVDVYSVTRRWLLSIAMRTKSKSSLTSIVSVTPYRSRCFFCVCSRIIDANWTKSNNWVSISWNCIDLQKSRAPKIQLNILFCGKFGLLVFSLARFCHTVAWHSANVCSSRCHTRIPLDRNARALCVIVLAETICISLMAATAFFATISLFTESEFQSQQIPWILTSKPLKVNVVTTFIFAQTIPSQSNQPILFSTLAFTTFLITSSCVCFLLQNIPENYYFTDEKMSKTNDNAEEEFSVEKVLNRRVRNGKVSFYRFVTASVCFLRFSVAFYERLYELSTMLMRLTAPFGLIPFCRIVLCNLFTQFGWICRENVQIQKSMCLIHSFRFVYGVYGIFKRFSFGWCSYFVVGVTFFVGFLYFISSYLSWFSWTP